MAATVKPQATATILSRRRSGGVGWPGIAASQWPDHDARAFDQRHSVDQQDENAERHRDRDRTPAATALLLCGEHDAGLGRLLVHGKAHEKTGPNGIPN